MLKIIHHHSYRIFTVFLALLIIAVTGLGILALQTYVRYSRYTSSRPVAPHVTIANHQRSQTPHAHQTANALSAVTPDVRIPPVTDGIAPVITSLPTSQRVVFLGIDDGAHKSPDELQMMQQNHIKASLFLSRLFINDNPDFFADFVRAGNVIENHTLNHDTTMVSTMSYEQQKAEICGMAEYEQQRYGRRPVLYRPPGGAYSTVMQRAAADCGMKAIVTWIAKANGGSMQYQVGDHLRPGDVVLMHFRPEFKQDMQAFLDAMKRQHLHTELIENWLP